METTQKEINVWRHYFGGRIDEVKAILDTMNLSDLLQLWLDIDEKGQEDMREMVENYGVQLGGQNWLQMAWDTPVAA